MPEAATTWAKFTPARKADIIKELYTPGNTNASDLSERIRQRYGVTVSRNGVIGFYGRNPELRETHPLTGTNQNANGAAGSSAKSEYVKKAVAAAREQARANRIREAAERRRLAEERKAERKLEATGKAEQIRLRQAEVEEFHAKEAHGVTIFELGDSVCRWPIGLDARDMSYCGRDDMAKGRPYCQFHARLAYTPKQN